MRKTALVTLGRLPKALDIVEALSLKGWRVVVAEPFGWHLCRVSRHVAKSLKVTAPNTNQTQFLNDLIKIIHEEAVSLVIPVSEEALHVALLEDKLPSDVRLFGMPQKRLLEFHDKHRFNQLAVSLGLSVPETYLLGDADAAKLAAKTDYILKPACTCSGQGLSFHQKGEALPDPGLLPKTVVQQKMTGALKSTFSITHEGRVIGTVLYKAAMLSGTVAVAFERLDNEFAIDTWIENFTLATGYSGFLSFDMMEDENGTPHAIECNPRSTSGIHFVSRDSIAGAILEPQMQDNLALRSHRVMQQFFPCLTETQIAFFRKNDFRAKLATLIRAKEVNFSMKDPLPLWLMPLTSWGIMQRSLLKGQSFGEASTFDIAWLAR